MCILLNKKGFVSLEIILYGIFMFLVISAVVGVFTYVYPTFELQREVHLLGKTAQANGGITNQNLSEFKNKVNKIPFVKESGKDVIIEASTSVGNHNVIGVNNGNYVSKSSRNVINIVVKVPSNNFISKFTNKSSDYYIFKTSVMSEKYLFFYLA